MIGECEIEKLFAEIKFPIIFNRLERTKSREGANLEYLKNVTISYLTTTEAEAKSKMLNAIGAVLKFDDYEIALISKVAGNSKKK